MIQDARFYGYGFYFPLVQIKPLFIAVFFCANLLIITSLSKLALHLSFNKRVQSSFIASYVKMLFICLFPLGIFEWATIFITFLFDYFSRELDANVYVLAVMNWMHC